MLRAGAFLPAQHRQIISRKAGDQSSNPDPSKNVSKKLQQRYESTVIITHSPRESVESQQSEHKITPARIHIDIQVSHSKKMEHHLIKCGTIKM